MKHSILFAALLAVAAVAAVNAGAPRPCDANGDGKVDKTDIYLIMDAIGVQPYVGDPRDVNADGFINIVDVRQCTLMCDKKNCAI